MLDFLASFIIAYTPPSIWWEQTRLYHSINTRDELKVCFILDISRKLVTYPSLQMPILIWPEYMGYRYDPDEADIKDIQEQFKKSGWLIGIEKSKTAEGFYEITIKEAS